MTHASCRVTSILFVGRLPHLEIELVVGLLSTSYQLTIQVLYLFSFLFPLLPPKSQIEKSQALEFVLHVSDIANPAKDWELHRQWTSRIMEEFFCQVRTGR